jgi:hypothetical protein
VPCGARHRQGDEPLTQPVIPAICHVDVPHAQKYTKGRVTCEEKLRVFHGMCSGDPSMMRLRVSALQHEASCTRIELPRHDVDVRTRPVCVRGALVRPDPA